MKLEQRERMIRARSAQFQYGIDKSDYSTSVGANFVKHELGGTVAQAKVERQNNGKDLRQSHFIIGTDNQKEAPLKEEQPSGFKPTQPLKEPEPSIHIDHIGVAAGEQGNARFHSTYKHSNRMHPNPSKLGGVLTPSQSANIPVAANMDMRSSNF